MHDNKLVHLAMLPNQVGTLKTSNLFTNQWLSSFFSCASILVETFLLCATVLPPKTHYDFGMRALLSTVEACQRTEAYDGKDEVVNTLLAIYRTNASKLDENVETILKLLCSAYKFAIVQDVSSFQKILEGFLPKKLAVNALTDLDSKLGPAIRKACAELNLVPTTGFLTKVIELHRLTRIRHGVILIGGTLTGKSTALKVLAHVLNKQYQNDSKPGQGLAMQIINPKAQPLSALFGCFKPVSHDWIDGLAGQMFRNFAQDMLNTESWLVFDGPIDPSWIEALNSVLDDNRKLCLSNGEVIPLSPKMRLIFETDNLHQASPATVSRCAIVNFSENEISWKDIGSHFTKERSKWVPAVENCFQTVLGSTTQCKVVVISTFRLIEAMIVGLSMEQQDFSRNSAAIFLHAFYKTGNWNLLPEQKEDWHNACMTNFKGLISADPDTVINLCPVVYRLDIKWIPWDQLQSLKAYSDVIKTTPFTGTLSCLQISAIIDVALTGNAPVMLFGECGTGKSAILSSYLTNLSPERYLVVLISVSASTTGIDFRELVLGRLIRKRKGVYHAGENKRAIVVLENLNQAHTDEFNGREILELIRSINDQKCWFDGKRTKVTLENVGFVCCYQIANNEMDEIFMRNLSGWFKIRVPDYSENDLLSIAWKNMGLTDAHADLQTQKQFKDLVQKLVLCHNECAKKLNNTSEICSKLTLKTLLQTLHQIMQTYKLKQNLEWGEEDINILVACCFRDNYGKSADILAKKYFEISERKYIPHFSSDEALNFLDMDKLQSFFTKLCSFHEKKWNTLDLMIFEYSAINLYQLMNVINNYVSHCVLIGMNGTGRTFLTSCAARFSDMYIEIIEYNRKLREIDWRDELKKLIRRVCIEEEPVCLLIKDSALHCHSFIIDDIELIVNGGQIRLGLFTPEERGEMIDKFHAMDIQNTEKKPVHLFYSSSIAKRLKQNMHVVLCLDDNERSRSFLNQRPSLLVYCNLIKFQPWSGDALSSIAKVKLKSLTLIDPVDFDKYVKLLANIHASAVKLASDTPLSNGQFAAVSPASFMHFLRLIHHLKENKYKRLAFMRDKYLLGVQQLNFAASQINVMQEELQKLRPQLIHTSAETGRLMTAIEHETVDVEEAKEVLATEEAKANNAATHAQTIKEECENDLAQAIPALEAAVRSLQQLNSGDISLLKTLKNPPLGVKLVMEAVCILLNEKPVRVLDPNKAGSYINEYWTTAKKILSDLHFLNRLKEFDKDSVSEKTIKEIKKRYVDSAQFQPAKVKHASVAAESICMWVRAVELYDRVNRVVRPKRQKLKQAENMVLEQMRTLDAKRSALLDVTETLQSLHDEFGRMTQKKKELQQQIRLCEIKIERAERLILGLGGEKSRWHEMTHELSATCHRFVNDILLVSAAIVYLSKYDDHIRQMQMQEWRKLMTDQNLLVVESRIVGVLGDEDMVRRWHAAGLAHDPLSLDNAAIIFNTKLWPLIIDPHGEAHRWLKKVAKGHVILTSAEDTDAVLFGAIENAVTMGLSLVIEGITQKLDSRLNALVQFDLYEEGTIKFLKIEGKSLHVGESFRLFLISSRRDVVFDSSIMDKVCLLNFHLTETAVEERLLDLFVSSELPGLQKKKQDLVAESVHHRNQLATLEDKILEVLTSAHGNILDDENAVDTLSQAKTLSEALLVKENESTATREEIESRRDQFRSVALHASKLFFLGLEMYKINFIYQFSLSWFCTLFQKVLDEIDSKEENLKKQISYIKKLMTERVFNDVAISFFQEDRVVLAFLIALNNELGINSNQCINMLLDRHYGTGQVESKLKRTVCLDKVLVSMNTNHEQTMFHISQFIKENLGRNFLWNSNFELLVALEQSKPTTPVVVILGSGVDPSRDICSIGVQKGMEIQNIHIFPLGQGTINEAELMIGRAVAEGWWIVLENCHLAALDWLILLEKVCEDLLPNLSTAHINFRLWMTMKPSPLFPAAVLQNSIKISAEAATNFISSLKHAFSKVMNSLTEGNNLNQLPVSKMMKYERLRFQLCWFHACALDRCNYELFGWHGLYSFGDQDLLSALGVIKDYAETPANGGSLQSLIIDSIYSSGMGHNHDIKVMKSLFKWIFNEKMEFLECCPDQPESFSSEEIFKWINNLDVHYINAGSWGLPEFALKNRAEQEANQFFEKLKLTTAMNNTTSSSYYGNARNESMSQTQAEETELENKLHKPFKPSWMYEFMRNDIAPETSSKTSKGTIPKFEMHDNGEIMVDLSQINNKRKFLILFMLSCSQKRNIPLSKVQVHGFASAQNNTDPSNILQLTGLDLIGAQINKETSMLEEFKNTSQSTGLISRLDMVFLVTKVMKEPEAEAEAEDQISTFRCPVFDKNDIMTKRADLHAEPLFELILHIDKMDGNEVWVRRGVYAWC